MDSEATVIRSEMNQTRADLDRKLAALEQRAQELSPRAVARRYMPEYAVEYALGGVLTLVGLRMAFGLYRGRRDRRDRRSRRPQVQSTVVPSRRWRQ